MGVCTASVASPGPKSAYDDDLELIRENGGQQADSVQEAIQEDSHYYSYKMSCDAEEELPLSS